MEGAPPVECRMKRELRPITHREIHCTLQREFPWEFPWGFPTLLEGSAPQPLGTVLFSTTIIIDDSGCFSPLIYELLMAAA